MKRIISVVLAFAMCASVAVAASGCGCQKKNSGSDKKSSGTTSVNAPGYRIEPTSPDFTEGDFGFYSISDKEVILTQYNGKSKNIEIPATAQGAKVIVVGNNVFENSDIESVKIPEGVTDINKRAFAGCKKLKSVSLPKTLKVIGVNAFWHCISLQEISLPSSLKKIDWYAFSATGLKKVSIPESNTLSSLSEKVFYQCSELTEVTLPLNITKIADDTFAECAEGFTIKAYTGSYGVSYAKAHKIKLEEMKRK